jgi:hypothetical protein
MLPGETRFWREQTGLKKTPQKQGALIVKSRERLPGITQLKVVGLVQLIDATHRTAVVF